MSTPGSHIVCTYGNVPRFNGTQQGHRRDQPSHNQDQGQHHDFGAYKNFLGQLEFMDQSDPPFTVTPSTMSTSAATTPTSQSQSSTGTNSSHPDDHGHDGHEGHGGHNGSHPDVTAIVGGVVGGVALILLIGLSAFFYRKLTYQRKLNQFHKEHLLLHQPPPSFLNSTGVSTIHAPPQVTSPRGTTAPRPLTPLRRSDVPVGFEETMRNYPYTFAPDNHSEAHTTPSSYSAPLPNEHTPVTYHAEHAPTMGTHQV